MGTFVVIVVFLLFVMASYSTRMKRNQIYCHFTGEDKTEEEKWIGTKEGFVIFRGRKFDIITRRITSFWISKGIHYLFPTRVNYLKFSWYSRFPHNPDNYDETLIDPAARKLIDKREMFKSYARSFGSPAVKKQGALAQYLPLIMIVLILAVGAYAYSSMQTLGQQMAIMQNTINAITK
ncbi:hypothetical protein LCGC14_3162510 [marine sediment metagenome]|uniref:Uncharacterized protein n=1 Tax=marine sediment metagenome TaxID=412755 RepID=A0A0F8WEZ9_9ZZZZ